MCKDVKYITYEEVFDKLKEKSNFIKDLNFKVKKNQITLDNILIDLFNNENHLTLIAHTIEKVYCSKIEEAKESLSALLSRNSQGSYYELLGYAWFISNNIEFEPQITPAGKNNKLEGCLYAYAHQIFFDIKTFEIPYNCIEKLRTKLSRFFPNYYVEVSGGYTASYMNLNDILSSDYFKVITDTLNGQLLDEKLDPRGYFASYKNEYVYIRLWRKDLYKGSSFSCSINPYAWAEQNENFFLDNSKKKQYTENAPFLSVCMYSDKFTFTDINIRLRSIARRTFIKFKENTKFLSAILFINISNAKGYFYLNPNAKNVFKRIYLNKIFFDPLNRWPFEKFDDFLFDNY